MPTDHAVETVEVAAPRPKVLRLIRDVESQPDWIPAILEVEVLEMSEDGLAATARLRASATVGTDEYTLAYDYPEDGLRWTMLKGRLQTGQEGSFTLAPVNRGHTSVTYDLTIHHNLPLPGFIRSRVIKGLVDDTLKGLKEYVEG